MSSPISGKNGVKWTVMNGQEKLAPRKDWKSLSGWLRINSNTCTIFTLFNERSHEAGRVLYSPLGGVLTSTVPATLTAALASQSALPDPAIGLVHLGNGRWYDPSVGRSLQPDPVGGPPSVPQALNRYAVPVGGTGVAQAAQPNILYNLGATALQSTIGSGIGKGLEAGIKQVGQALDVGYLRVNPWRLYQLKNAGYRHLFTYHRQGWYISEAVQPVGDDVLSVVGRSEQIALSRLRSIRGLKWELDWPLSAKAGKWLRGLGGEFLAASAVELALAYPELAEPWGNPYLSDEQRWVQNSVTGSRALISAGLSAWLIATTEASFIPGIGIGIGVGVAVYGVFEYGFKPFVSFVFTTAGRSDPYQDYRNLKPVGGGG